MKSRPTNAALLLAVGLIAGVSAADAPLRADLGALLKQQREVLAGYEWRLKTDVKVDGALRFVSLENVHLAPEGGLDRKIVKFDIKPSPTPFPEGDPRSRLTQPATQDEASRYMEQAQRLLDLYARLSPDRLRSWASRAESRTGQDEHAGETLLHARGLVRPQDDVVVYLDGKKKTLRSVEVKTTVDFRLTEIAFLRIRFEPIDTRAPAPLIAPKSFFVNMDRGRRHVTLEMEASEYRTWR